MKKLIIFDMDGLLLDTEMLYQKFWLQVIQENNITITKEQLSSIVGQGFEQTKQFFVKHLGSEEAFYELRRKREEGFWKEIEANGLPTKEGAFEILEQLRQKKVMTALITSTEEQRARKLLNCAHLTHKFDFMVFSNNVSKTKPDPEVYHYLEKRTDIPKSDWLVFEDSYNGIKAANNADVDVIWIRDLIDLTNRDIHYVATYHSLLEVIKTHL